MGLAGMFLFCFLLNITESTNSRLGGIFEVLTEGVFRSNLKSPERTAEGYYMEIYTNPLVQFSIVKHSSKFKVPLIQIFFLHPQVTVERKFVKMSSTSQKHRNFTAEVMGEKSVDEVAGIGEVLSERLSNKGFDKAYHLLGQFLLLRKDEELFQSWLKDTISANDKQARDCSACLHEWCDMFI